MVRAQKFLSQGETCVHNCSSPKQNKPNPTPVYLQPLDSGVMYTTNSYVNITTTWAPPSSNVDNIGPLTTDDSCTYAISSSLVQLGMALRGPS
jgi:hypothetical protein